MYSRSKKHAIRPFIPMLIILALSLTVLGWMLSQSRVFETPFEQSRLTETTPEALRAPELKSPESPLLAEAQAGDPVQTTPAASYPSSPVQMEGVMGSKASAGTAVAATNKNNQETIQNAPESIPSVDLALADTAEATTRDATLPTQLEPMDDRAATTATHPIPRQDPLPALTPETLPLNPAAQEPPTPETTMEIVPEAEATKAIQEEARSEIQKAAQKETPAKPVAEPAPLPEPLPTTASLVEAFANTPSSTRTIHNTTQHIPSELAYNIDAGERPSPTPSEETRSPARTSSTNTTPRDPNTGWIYAGQFKNGSWVSAGLMLDGRILPTPDNSYTLAWGANVRASPPGQRNNENGDNLARNIGYIAENKKIKVLSVTPSGQQGHIWLEIEY